MEVTLVGLLMITRKENLYHLMILSYILIRLRNQSCKSSMINLTVFDEYACFSLHLFWFDGDDLVQYCLIPEHPITYINSYYYFSNLSHSNLYDACFRFYFFTSIIYSVVWIMNAILSISIFLPSKL